jgi:hypothetical protein
MVVVVHCHEGAAHTHARVLWIPQEDQAHHHHWLQYAPSTTNNFASLDNYNNLVYYDVSHASGKYNNKQRQLHLHRITPNSIHFLTIVHVTPTFYKNKVFVQIKMHIKL